MTVVPSDAPDTCPACGREYESVTAHEKGIMVNLLENERYRRVCFEPENQDGTAVLQFYHHTHDQANASSHAVG